MKFFRSTTRIVAAVVVSASASQASEVADCRLDLAKASFGIVRAYHATMAACLKFGNYSNCDFSGASRDTAIAALVQAVSSDDSSCTAALASGATMSDIAPANCSGNPFYDGSPGDYYSDCTSAITDLESLQFCAVCQSIGLGARFRFGLDLPQIEPESADDRRCIRSTQKAVAQAVRIGVQDALRCARTVEPPWACALDVSAESHFGKSLAGISKRTAKCRDESGIQGNIGRATSEMCNSAIASSAELAACMQKTTTCQTCLAINVELGESLDCVALSGDADCRFGAIKQFGSFVVANQDDSTASLYDAEGNPINGTLAASTFPVGASPAEVAISEKTNSVFVINSGGASVTGLRANTGAPINGTLAQSTVAVGASPGAALVHPDLDILYVANAADGTITLLDASDLSYAFGTLAASTFPVGSAPSALAMDRDATILYVANAGDGTITFIDAATGKPWFDLLATSTFVAGTEPRGLVLMPLNYSEQDSVLVVADGSDGLLRTIDATSGLPLDELDGAPSSVFGPGPLALAASPHLGRIYGASSAVPEVLTWSANRGAEPTMAGGTPSDVAMGGTELLVTISDKDEVVLSDTDNPISNLGVAPGDASTVFHGGNYRDWIYSQPRDDFFAVGCYQSGSTLAQLDATNLSVSQSIAVPGCASGIAYGAAEDTVYVSSYDFMGQNPSITYVDPATGSGRFGTIESSTFTCGCNDPDYNTGFSRIVVNEAANRLYLICGIRRDFEYMTEDYEVTYMDTSTGACLGAVPGGAARTMVVDESSGRVFVTPGSPANGIYELDPVVPQYLNGTREASLVAGTEGYTCGAMHAGSDGKIYASCYDTLITVDTSTDSVVSQGGFYGAVDDREIDSEHGIVRQYWEGYEIDVVVYRNLSDAEYVTGDYYTSRIELPREFEYDARFVPVPGKDYTVLADSNRIARIRRDSPAFINNDRTLGGTIVPTGRHPSAVASMPALTGY